MVVPEYSLFDTVEMKKAHPCSAHTKLFQIIRVGADIKIKCLGCGNVIMMDRASFNTRIRKIIQKNEGLIQLLGQK